MERTPSQHPDAALTLWLSIHDGHETMKIDLELAITLALVTVACVVYFETQFGSVEDKLDVHHTMIEDMHDVIMEDD